MKDLGIDPVPSLVGFIWKEDFEATERRQDRGASGGGRARPTRCSSNPMTPGSGCGRIVKPASDGEFKALIASYRGGIPGALGRRRDALRAKSS